MARRWVALWSVVLAVALALGAPGGEPARPAAAQGPTGCTTSVVGTDVTITCATPGSYTWTVPTGLSVATFDVYGAQGGSGGGSAGGRGGRARASVSLVPEQTLQINVGGRGNDASSLSEGSGGFGGGASGGPAILSGSGESDIGSGGGGGGGADVRSGAPGLGDRFTLGGGGGGGGGNNGGSS